ncbi:hypothetical protein ASPNIDRAFT_36526 [Aspergillus niger ATCC 1015]|uniref:SRR1-like domain-containing protein n=2 Tax=Aspergillus niger TaxID=5061 RepID=G3XTI0_ASPNA|nr:hypothetical protein ASPNIDRAFT_36526 [Aspergillus niger ATCC 1015]KAI2966044.1 hypothetical protein CBS147323_5584 [Aspergillus niger]KAI3005497.1 hypothetical protein CBS147345_7568 [Aspergillus niger]KAI3019636.1 hypothetical protein CBS147347_8931 [Aspergillus niger]TPR12084.1 hypothetical protein CAN33_0051945 [Aspergillus niger]
MEVAVTHLRTLVGLATRTDPSPLPPVQDIISHIQSLYDSGRPFYTKDLLQCIKEQLRDARDGIIQTIRVPGVDGVIVEFPVMTGQVFPTPEQGMELIVRNPCIEYLSVQELLQVCDLRDENLAYNHIQIGHYRFLRNILTKELYSKHSVASVPDASELLQRSSRIWENTAQCQALREILMSRKDVSISRIVGLALGSFATVYPSLQDRSAFQHALLLTLRDIYCNMQNIAQQSIPCFAQDPMCNIVDITAAEEAGIKILEDPDGFLEIDDSTVVFSCAPDIPVRQIVLDLARPAVLIWDKLRNEDDDDHSADPSSPRVMTCLRNFYEEFEFPDYDEHFGGLAVYIRRN